MNVSVSDAKASLTELVRKAEEGEEVVLTRFGQPVARILAIPAKPTRAERRAAIDAACALARGQALPGPSAARSADFLYDEHGLPG